MAWAEDRNPLYIFRSSGNSDFSVESSHPNSENYQVDRLYRLTITKVNINKDADTYTCRIVFSSGDDERDFKYYLNVRGTRAAFRNLLMY